MDGWMFYWANNNKKCISTFKVEISQTDLVILIFLFIFSRYIFYLLIVAHFVPVCLIHSHSSLNLLSGIFTYRYFFWWEIHV